MVSISDHRTEMNETYIYTWDCDHNLCDIVDQLAVVARDIR